MEVVPVALVPGASREASWRLRAGHDAATRLGVPHPCRVWRESTPVLTPKAAEPGQLWQKENLDKLGVKS